jgi:hypothetical protein
MKLYLYSIKYKKTGASKPIICKCYYLKDGYHVFILEDDSEKKIPESEADVQLDIATGNKSPADVLRDRGDSRKI